MQQGSSGRGTSVEAALIMEAPESVKANLLVAQSHLTLCDPMDCGLPDSSVPGVLQARIWRGLPCPSSGDLSNPGIEQGFPALQADSLPAELKNSKDSGKIILWVSPSFSNSHTLL